MINRQISSLITAINACPTAADLHQLLKGLLTPQEIEEVARRLEIVKQLKQGVPQREIAKRLGVGIATITRGVREIRRGYFDNVS